MSLSRIVTLSKDPEVQKLAQKYGRKVFGADDLADAVEIIQTANPDLILFDQWLGINNVREFIFRTSNNDKNEFVKGTDNYSTNIPIVVVGCGDDNTELAAEFINIGAYGYLNTRQDYAQLERIINRIKSKSKDTIIEKNKSTFFSDDLACSASMVGSSKSILDTLNMIKLVAASRCNPILIVGETGTGKELAANAIHILRHPNEKFVAVNCAALTANLLESELFGHVKGSFTGADREKTGLLELAESGTLLLDEISEMPMDLQAKLLRVLQEKSFRKVGGIKDIACNATIMASSNRNLKNEVQANRFRRDLYYRLNICPITLSPLRSKMRRQDIRLLAEYFLRTSTICPDKCGKITSLTELAIEALEKHDWPGNVRELCNVIERAILLETTEKIGLNGIVIEPTEWADASINPTPGLIKDFSLAKAECELIARALQKTGWQKTRAAALLGITRATLYAKVKQYNIEKNSHVVCSTKEQSQNEVTSSYLHKTVAVPS
jgi:DNA-binding NtrC family response regulator